MAAWSSSSPLLLLYISFLVLLFTPGSAFLNDGDHMTSTAPIGPHFTECVSRDQATFRCWWSPGTFHNLSSPGALSVFYLKKDSLTSEWKECPDYNYSMRECFFDQNHTSIWKTYCVQLRSQNNITYFNEDDCFTVENIVRPDPPLSLNWTLLNVSPSMLSYDVIVSWEPPPSAEVQVGWMRIEYEMQYREKNSTNWKALVVQPFTKQTIYGLNSGKEYEVHIRSRMQVFTKFGEFSESIFIQLPEIEPIESSVSLTIVIVFGVVGILILIMLIVISQQHRLMMVLLPPVPAPKIKGIDSELLKKGKLDELNFILSGGGMGGLPPYTPNFYQDEPWVEFIEVDVDDADSGDKEDNQGSDTQRLLTLHQPVRHHMNKGCSNSVSYPDEDSGQASRYDPGLSEQESLILLATFLPGQTEEEEEEEEEEGPRDVAETTPASDLVQTGSAGQQTWMNTDFYAQVSNVMPSGGVVLSPGQHPRIQESASTVEDKEEKKGKASEDAEEQKQKELQFQLLVVSPEGSDSTRESSIQQISPLPMSPGIGLAEGYQTIQPQPVESNKPAATVGDSTSPYILPDSPQPHFFAPVADYSVVQELDSHHSFLLHPTPHQTPPPCLPQHPHKAPMPIGYITPDLLGNLSP